MRTNLIAAAVALAVALLPSAALAEKTRLTAVSGPVSGGWYLGVGLVAKAFTDANPNYEVTMLPGNSTSNVIQLQQKKADLSIGMHTMNMAAIKGTAPYKKAFPNIAAYAKQGGLAALSDYADFAELSGNYLEAPLSTNLYQRKYYGLPLDTNCKAAVVNTNVLKSLGLDEVPATMEAFIEAAKARGTYSLNVSGVGDWDMYPYFWLFGGELTDDGFTKATGYLDSDKSIAAMEKIVALHNDKVLTIRDVDGSVDAWDGINSEYAMFFEGPWYFGSYEDCTAKGIVAATIPTYEGRSASVVGGEDIAVFATSKYPEAAYEFAKFMTSEEVQLAMLEAGQLPILKSLVDSEAVQNNPVWSVYMRQMESAKARIPSPNNSAIQEIWSEMVTGIFVDGADVAQSLHDAAAKIDEQLR